MKKFNINHRLQGGYTLTALLVVVGLIGAAIATAVGIYMLVQGGQRGKQLGTDLIVLQSSVRQVNPQPSFPATLTEGVVIHAGRAPRKLISGNTLRAPWGSAIEIDGNVTYGGVTGAAFNIAIYDAPRQVCIDVLDTVATQFQRIVVGTTTVKDESADIVLDAATLTDACDPVSTNLTFTTAG